MTDALVPGDPLEEELMEVEAPRRAASAQFVVEAGIGSEAALREAMDPANQSLADALRLSFRLLQIVIVVLLALFFISGFTIVDDRQSGVMLRFGRIVPVGGQEALEPGRSWNVLPYPAGEFVIFDVENRSVDFSRTFWPNIPPNVTLEAAISGARTSTPLRLGRNGDGYVITRDGDLAHLQLTAGYEVSDPVLFVERIDLDTADRLVALTLQRAVIEVAGGLSLQELVELSEDDSVLIRARAQQVLDSLKCGIELTAVQVPEARPPLAIVKAYGELQNAREEVRELIEHARKDAEQTLIDIAGPGYRELIRMVEEYEEAVAIGDERSEALLARINESLESEDVRGQLAAVIERAKAYESEIGLTLGNELERFRSVLGAYREHPELVAKRRWLDAYTVVLSRPDTEIFYVPADVGSIDLRISGLENIQRKRQQNKMERRRMESLQESMKGLERFMPRARDIRPGKAKPLLEVDQEGRIRPRGSGN